MVLTCRELFRHLRDNKIEISNNTNVKTKLFNFVRLCYGNISESTEEQIRTQVNLFVLHLHQRWMQANRNEDRFSRKYANWLNINLNLPTPRKKRNEILYRFNVLQITSYICTTLIISESRSSGRPITPFEKSSDRTKRRKVAEKSALLL